MKHASGAVGAARRTEAFIDPFDSRVLLDYFDDIFRWHGFIRFVGLPYFREQGHVPIANLFVEPRLSRSYARPEPFDTPSDVVRVSEELVASPRLVILGDPGSGKSTLVSWIAWQLSNPLVSELSALSGFVPVPVVLRELDLASVHDVSSLFGAMLAHPSLQRLRTENLFQDLLKRGQAYMLLDGLDEIGATYRRTVVGAVRNAITEASRCRWVLTSRVVGYDDNAVERSPRDGTRPSEAAWTPIDRRYIAPMADDQMESFAARWFEGREGPAGAAKARDFIDAIRKVPQTRQLARIPNLLTLMAMIYRVQSHLPHGRALLYDKITEAYLETIPSSKDQLWRELSLPEKRRALGYVAFHMQRHRSDEEREILVSSIRVRELLAEVAGEKTRGFFDYLCERSGLLQQRGPDLFAFAHLSFQDYFSATYLADQVTSPRWIRDPDGRVQVTRADLRRYFADRDWREAIILLFELLSRTSDWPDTLLVELYGEDLQLENEEGAATMAAICIDPHSGLSAHTRRKGLAAAWAADLEAQQASSFFDMSTSPRPLVTMIASAASDIIPVVWHAFGAVVRSKQPRKLNLHGARPFPLEDVFPDTVESLTLEDSGVADLGYLAKLTRLRVLSLTRSQIEDLNPLRRLEWLWLLDVSYTRVADLSPVVELPRLSYLYVDGTTIPPRQLAEFTKLESLSITRLPINDLGFLANFQQLQSLWARGTALHNIEPIAEVHGLKTLSIADTQVDSLEPLRNLHKLEWLSVADTPVASLEPLVGHENLAHLDLTGTRVNDFTPLFSLVALKNLSLPTGVSDDVRRRIRMHLPTVTIH